MKRFWIAIISTTTNAAIVAMAIDLFIFVFLLLLSTAYVANDSRVVRVIVTCRRRLR